MFHGRHQLFERAREALLRGDLHEAQEAAGRMPTSPDGFVSSFEYVGELQLEFDIDSDSPSSNGGGGPVKSKGPNGDAVEGYIRHLHLNNGTGA